MTNPWVVFLQGWGNEHLAGLQAQSTVPNLLSMGNKVKPKLNSQGSTEKTQLLQKFCLVQLLNCGAGSFLGAITSQGHTPFFLSFSTASASQSR